MCLNIAITLKLNKNWQKNYFQESLIETVREKSKNKIKKKVKELYLSTRKTNNIKISSTTEYKVWSQTTLLQSLMDQHKIEQNHEVAKWEVLFSISFLQMKILKVLPEFMVCPLFL